MSLRVDNTEEKVSEIEYITIEIIQIEAQRERKLGRGGEKECQNYPDINQYQAKTL